MSDELTPFWNEDFETYEAAATYQRKVLAEVLERGYAIRHASVAVSNMTDGDKVLWRVLVRIMPPVSKERAA